MGHIGTTKVAGTTERKLVFLNTFLNSDCASDPRRVHAGCHRHRGKIGIAVPWKMCRVNNFRAAATRCLSDPQISPWGGWVRLPGFGSELKSRSRSPLTSRYVDDLSKKAPADPVGVHFGNPLSGYNLMGLMSTN